MTWPNVGELFEGRYRIERLLGQGGQADVFLATDAAATRSVAIKVLKRDGEAYAQDVAARHQRELRIVAGLRDPHTVIMYDHGRTDDGLLFLVFEYVEGCDLAEVLAERERLDVPTTIHIVEQLLCALREAHSHGLLHRDIKPENVRVFEYMGDPWRVKLLDFGIARPQQRSASDVTKAGELVGTPRYMSPEQLREAEWTASSDIYSLGLVAYELVLGRSALHGARLSDQLDRLRTGHLVALPTGADAGFHAVLSKMTAVKPGERFQSAEEVLAALNALQRVAVPISPPPAQRRSSNAWPAVAVAALCLVVVAVFLMWSPKTENSSPKAENRVDGSRENPLAGAASSAPEPEQPDSGAAEVDAMVALPDGCGKPWAQPVGEKIDLTRRHQGHKTWPAWVPRGYDPDERHPLVFVFHSSGHSAVEFMRESNIGDLADDKGFIVIAPEDDGSSRDSWRSVTESFLRAHAPPGRAAFAAALSAAKAQLCIDDTRVFAIGHGNGGRPAEDLRCALPLAAIATTRYRADEGSRICEAAVPTLHIAPGDDCNYPIDGGKGCNQWYRKSSLAATQSRFKAFNGCSGPETKNGPCSTWKCEAAYETCIVEGAIWPHIGDQTGPETKFDVGAKIWRFFESSPPRAAERK